MTSSGMARKVDDLGRIVLPVETRRLFGIHPGDALEISVAEGAIMLRKMEKACAFCDGDIDVREFKGKLVCRPCVDELSGVAPQASEAESPAPDSEPVEPSATS